MSVSFAAVVLGSPDPPALAAFYRELLGWDTVEESPGWVRLRDRGGSAPASASSSSPRRSRPPGPPRPGSRRCSSTSTC